MAYKIDWIGEVAIGVQTDGGRPLMFSLEVGQRVPEEFKGGDEIRITNHADHPANLTMGMNSGYHEIMHACSGKVLKTWHPTEDWKVK